jgi:ubiquitin C-terminal hydrolase
MCIFHTSNAVTRKLFVPIVVDSMDVDVPLQLADGSVVTRRFTITGVVAHRGATANSGHYIALVRRGQQFWQCDDAHVQLVDNPIDHINRQWQDPRLHDSARFVPYLFFLQRL